LGSSKIPETYVCDNPVHLLEANARTVGFYGFTKEYGELLLDKLSVVIDLIGRRPGKALWRHAVNPAQKLDHTECVIGSDPNAAGYYKAMGAVWNAEKTTVELAWTVQAVHCLIPRE